MGTPLVNESYGHYLAVCLLEEVLEVIYTSIIVNYKGRLSIFVLGDNIPVLNALHSDSKEVSIRDSASKDKDTSRSSDQ